MTWRNLVKELAKNQMPEVVDFSRITNRFGNLEIDLTAWRQTLEYVNHFDESCDELGGFHFLNVDGLLALHDDFISLAEDVDDIADDMGEIDPRIQPVIYHKKRIPIAEFNGDVFIFIDVVPSKKGIRGQVIQVDPESLNMFWLADSFEALLQNMLSGKYLNPDLGCEEHD